MYGNTGRDDNNPDMHDRDGFDISARVSAGRVHTCLPAGRRCLRNSQAAFALIRASPETRGGARRGASQAIAHADFAQLLHARMVHHRIRVGV